MSSAFLYLGIVVMWLCVLVPMWLRRDRHTVDIAELYADGEDDDSRESAECEESDDSEECEEPEGDTLADHPVSRVSGISDTSGVSGVSGFSRVSRVSGVRAHAADPADDEITMELDPSGPRRDNPSHHPSASHHPGASRHDNAPGDPRASRRDDTSRDGDTSRRGDVPRRDDVSRRDDASEASSSPVTRAVSGTGSSTLSGAGHAFGSAVPDTRTPVGAPVTRAADSPATPAPSAGPDETSDEDTAGEYAPGRDDILAERRRRAGVVARRRRWLLFSVLLHIASVVTAGVGVAPWWSVAPSAVVLLAYLAVLRVAVAVDAERRVAAAKAHAEQLRKAQERRRALELAAEQAEAEVIEFRKPAEPFDQYADRSRRAVGD
ncbi:hypothetical protein ABZT47_23715 [Sphaerisporangium sp. NPDC005289]|uniref:divisome protein SepX/GlpR n=1 Tax=Sphaerisporangium sp. NPDC005289 TaxID=3155247 RepID=UPI0033B7910A